MAIVRRRRQTLFTIPIGENAYSTGQSHDILFGIKNFLSDPPNLDVLVVRRGCHLIAHVVPHQQAIEKGDWLRPEPSSEQVNRFLRGARRGGSPFFNPLQGNTIVFNFD
jgi:hypothetical protein